MFDICDLKRLVRLLTATPEDEDPVSLLQGAARDHIPVNPKSPKPLESPRQVPGPQQRPSITEILTEMEEQEWVTDQIVHQKVFEEKSPQNGRLLLAPSPIVSCQW